MLAKSGVEMSFRLAFASEDAEGEPLRSRVLRSGDDAERLWSVSCAGEVGSAWVFVAAVCGLSLKMWMVSVAEETQRSVLVALKDMQCILAGMLPRRNW